MPNKGVAQHINAPDSSLLFTLIPHNAVFETQTSCTNRVSPNLKDDSPNDAKREAYNIRPLGDDVSLADLSNAIANSASKCGADIGLTVFSIFNESIMDGWPDGRTTPMASPTTRRA